MNSKAEDFLTKFIKLFRSQLIQNAAQKQVKY